VRNDSEVSHTKNRKNVPGVSLNGAKMWFGGRGKNATWPFGHLSFILHGFQPFSKQQT